MSSASLYKSNNDMQRRDAKETIDKYWYKLQWRKDGGDSILDIGVASGDVAYDYIWPQLPENYSRYVGIDYSGEMVEYARKHYPHPKASYEKYDISSNMEKQHYKHEPYDHIVSFFNLNWVQNQKQAHQNMWKLLKPGGDMLVGILAHNPIYDIYKEMSRDKKWAKYMSDVDQYISPYHYSKDPAEDYRKLLSSYGYTDIYVEVLDKYYIYEGSEALKYAWKAVNPWYEKIPAQDQEAYWNDYLNYVAKYGYALDDYKTNPTSCRYKDPYKWMVAYAKK